MARVRANNASGGGGGDFSIASMAPHTFAGTVTLNKDYKKVICTWDPNYYQTRPLIYSHNGSSVSWDDIQTGVSCTVTGVDTQNSQVAVFVKNDTKAGDTISCGSSTFKSLFLYFE